VGRLESPTIDAHINYAVCLYCSLYNTALYREFFFSPCGFPFFSLTLLVTIRNSFTIGDRFVTSLFVKFVSLVFSSPKSLACRPGVPRPCRCVVYRKPRYGNRSVVTRCLSLISTFVYKVYIIFAYICLPNLYYNTRE